MKSWERFTFIILFASASSFAAPVVSAPRPCSNPTVDELQIKLHQDSAEIPAPITKPKPVTPFGCERPFIYRNEAYSSDSPQAQDAATLHFFVKSVPEAASVLDEYQNNRNKSHISAYTGTFGVILMFLAPAISRSFFDASVRETAFKAIQFTGAGLAVGGFVYSFTLLRTNENLIPKSVDIYNQNKPQDPIELKFTTGWRF